MFQLAGRMAHRAMCLARAGLVNAGGSCWLRAETSSAPPLPCGVDSALVLTSQAVAMPANPGQFWNLEATAANYQALIERFSTLRVALDRGDKLRPLDAIATRTLLVHDWRRAVLHDPGLPEDLLPGDWPGETARMVAKSIYANLGAASERWLDGAGLPPLADPTSFAGRFGIFQSSR